MSDERVETFDLVYLRDTPRVAVERLGPFPSIALAANARRVSGQLVVYGGTTDVVPCESWLWHWERLAKEESYAWREVRAAQAALDASKCTEVRP